VRVYLTNVESICRRFCDEKRGRLAWLRSEGAGFCAWWRSLRADAQRALTRGVAGGPILKGLVRQFFNEKEVTSTLVMDALFCGCKQLDRLARGQVRSSTAHDAAAAAYMGCAVLCWHMCI
jgi:diadenosine tetraphosphatase ApaH/serine/threonine PP2A family protein phosphatase